mgnify:CR=1 FL=1
MKRTINEHDFVNAFQGTYKNHFSYEGKIALYEYLTQLEEDTGFEMELDAIAICCDFTEYNSFKEWKDDFGDSLNLIKDIDALKGWTNVIEFSGEFDNMIIVQEW